MGAVKTIETPAVEGAVRVLAGRVKGGGLVIAALLGVGGGAGVVAAVDDGDHLASLERRVEVVEHNSRELDKKVADSDHAERLAALETTVAESARADAQRDELIARLVHGSKVQLRYTKWVGEQIQRIGSKVGVAKMPLPLEIREAVTADRMDDTRAEVNRLLSPP